MWTSEFWKATGERVIRGAVVAVAGVYVGGDLVFDLFQVDTWRDIGSLAVSGAFTSLLLSLVGNAISGNGPAFVNSEVLSPPAPDLAHDGHGEGL